MKKLSNRIMTLSMSAFILMSMFFVSPANATTGVNKMWGTDAVAGDVHSNVGLEDTDPRTMAAKVINIMLGFLGIIAVVIILLGGFKWMTSGGSEDKVGEAKKLIGAGVIGLIIVMASFGIATFVLDAVFSATGA